MNNYVWLVDIKTWKVKLSIAVNKGINEQKERKRERDRDRYIDR